MAVPSTGPAERVLRAVHHLIADEGGSAVLLSGRATAGDEEMTAAFNSARDRQYQDIIAASGRR
jgi:hypothetical protein